MQRQDDSDDECGQGDETANGGASETQPRDSNPGDDGERGRHSEESGTSECRGDARCDRRKRGKHDEGAGPRTASTGIGIEQPQPAGEGELQIHRRDRGIEERARCAQLTADDVEAGPEERERPHHPWHLGRLEHRDDRNKNSHGEERADDQARARCAIDGLGDDKRHRPCGGEPAGKSNGVASLEWRRQRREHDNRNEGEAGDGDRRPRGDRGPRVPDHP